MVFPFYVYDSYHATRGSKAMYNISSDNKELRVIGKELDRVAKIHILVGVHLDQSNNNCSYR